MFLLNKIIKNKKLKYPQKKMLVVHMVVRFYNHVQGLLNNPWFRRALQMVLKPCARPPKQPMILLYMV